jgi:hypothetical protein
MKDAIMTSIGLDQHVVTKNKVLLTLKNCMPKLNIF